MIEERKSVEERTSSIAFHQLQGTQNTQPEDEDDTGIDPTTPSGAHNNDTREERKQAIDLEKEAEDLLGDNDQEDSSKQVRPITVEDEEVSDLAVLPPSTRNQRLLEQEIISGDNDGSDA